jgi:hypothetical protein
MVEPEFNATANLPTTNTTKVGLTNLVYRLFLLTTAVMPLASLFWDVNFFWVKANWAPYPIFLIGLFLVPLRKRVPTEFLALIFLTAFYLLLAYLGGGEMESILRFAIAIMPLTLYFLFEHITDSRHRYFGRIYGALMVIPLVNSYLQYNGKLPYSEFDYVDDVLTGRLSGGYQKPHNLVAYLVPIFLLGFYIWKVKQRKLWGMFIVFTALIAVYMINYRTSLIAFLTILLSSFFMRTTLRTVYTYYRYFLNFFVPVLAFISLRLVFSTVGLWDKLRGRVPIWELHAWQYFDWNIFNITFGAQKVLIEDAYRDPSVVLNEEVHNNSFRTILVFGLAGFFLYCLLMRKIVLHIKKKDYPSELKFVLISGFTYFIFYTITNEPMYYGSVLWPILIWIFLAQSMPSRKASNQT